MASGDRGGRGSSRRAKDSGGGRITSQIGQSSLIVRRTLAAYAERGIFRAFSDRERDRGQRQFAFRWHTNVTLNVVYDPFRRELTFRDLLPGVIAGSGMLPELRRFLRARTSRTLPEHRRVDPEKATFTLKNRRGTVSLVASLTDAHLEYGVRKTVNLIHELFVDFLRHPLYFPYMVEHFEVDPDT